MSASAPSPSVATIHHWIDGKPFDGPFVRCGDVFNPSTGAVSAHVAFASEPDLDRCVASAKAALPGWAATPPLRRARVMFRFRQLLEAASEEIAATISREHGKTLADARGEAIRGMEVVE